MASHSLRLIRRGVRPLLIRNHHGGSALSARTSCVFEGLRRSYTNDAGNVIVEKDKGFAIMRMNRKPVNGLSKDLLEDMTAAILDVESDPEMEGLVITSTRPNVFSAGVDLSQVYQAPLEKIQDFWSAFQDWWLQCYGTRLATIAAINGHSLAGGAVVALSCDYRIMARGPYTIGLNESERDIVLPFFVNDLLKNTVGHRQAEMAAQLGLAYDPDGALRIGMVDELVAEEKLMERAKEEIGRWLKIGGATRSKGKRQLREPMLRDLLDKKREDMIVTAQRFHSDAVQKKIETFLQRKK